MKHVLSDELDFTAFIFEEPYLSIVVLVEGREFSGVHVNGSASGRLSSGRL
jgi:hypothetical protein